MRKKGFKVLSVFLIIQLFLSTLFVQAISPKDDAHLYDAYRKDFAEHELIRIENQSVVPNANIDLTSKLEDLKKLEQGTLYLEVKPKTSKFTSFFSITSNKMYQEYFMLYRGTNGIVGVEAKVQPNPNDTKKFDLFYDSFANSKSKIGNNEWSSIAVTYNEGSLKLYVNGKFIFESKKSARFFKDLVNANHAQLGKALRTSTYNWTESSFDVNNFTVYNKSLTAEEVQKRSDLFVKETNQNPIRVTEVKSVDTTTVDLVFDHKVLVALEPRLELENGNEIQLLSQYNANTLRFRLDPNDAGQKIIGLATGEIIGSNRETINFESTLPGVKVVNPNIDLSTYGRGIIELFNAGKDNTWVFTGGKEVQSDYNQTQGIRNYVGQFEEYVRWTEAQSGTAVEKDNKMQRYAFNTAKTGTTVKMIADNYDEFVGKYQPKAVAYMLSESDYSRKEAGLVEFKAGLKSLVEQSLAVNRFVVIQKGYPTNNDEKNVEIERYNAAMDEVLKLFGGQRRKIGIVDYYTANNTAEFKTTLLDESGLLNAKGHFEIGKQFSQATIKKTAGYPGNNVRLDLEEVSKVKTYLDVAPTVTYSENELKVRIPESVDFSQYKYIVRVGNRTLEGNATEKEFDVALFEENENYEISIQSNDGSKQLKTLQGRTVEGETAHPIVSVLNDNQTALQNKLASKDKLTWLFMGDSITHGALWTIGYDSVPQLFEKFLRHDLKREKDIVLNTAVSGATTTSTLNNIEERLNIIQMLF